MLAIGSLAAYEPTHADDVSALRALYHSADGAAWSAPRWMKGDPCGDAPYYCGVNCQGWHGVHCWGPGGRVRKLDLHGRNLRGVLPTQLGLLTALAALDLSGSSGLSGTLPSELGRVPFHRTDADGSALLLSGSRISGLLPATFALLPEYIERCRLPPMLHCAPPMALPPACSMGKGRQKGVQVAAVAAGSGPCTPARVAMPLASRCESARGTSIADLCEAMTPLGISSVLGVASVVDSLVARGIASLPRLLALTAPMLNATMLSATQASSVAGLTSTSTSTGLVLRQVHAEAALGARQSLLWQGELEWMWASALRQPSATLRARLSRCCRRAPMVGARVTRGRWRTQKMHPCCAPLTDPTWIRRAVARDGDGDRLSALVNKLRRGQSITAVAVGGSISTREYAGCTRNVGAVAGEGGPGCSYGRGWARMVVDFLNAVWPPRDGSRHHLVSFGRTGGAADGFVDCLTTHLTNLSRHGMDVDQPPASADGADDSMAADAGQTSRRPPKEHSRTAPSAPADLFLLEFTITGFASSGNSAAPLEALVRRLLALPGAPALLAVNFFPLLANKESAWERPMPRAPMDGWLAPFSATLPGLSPTLPDDNDSRRSSGDARSPASASRRHGTSKAVSTASPRRPLDVAQLQLQEQAVAVYAYYGLPVVSARDGLMPALRSGASSPLDWVIWGDFGFHPPPSTQSFIAGAVVEVLRRHADSAMMPAWTNATDGADVSVGEKSVGALPDAREAIGEIHRARLPTPLHTGLQERPPLACYVWGVDYKHNYHHFGYRMLGPPPTLRSYGWELTLEQRTSRAGARRTNPGLRANVSGAELVVRLDTTLALAGSAGVAAGDGSQTSLQPVLQLEFLASDAERMGTLVAVCIAGCACARTKFSAAAPRERGSRHVLGCMPVSESPTCDVRFTTSGAAGRAKFVLHALRVLVQHRSNEDNNRKTASSTECGATTSKSLHQYLS